MSTPDYCTVQEVKDHLPDQPWNGNTSITKYDTIITSLISRASREVDRLTNRKPGAFAVTADTIRYFDGAYRNPNQAYILPNETTEPPILMVGELAAAPTTVEVKEDGTNFTTWSASDYFVWPYNAIDEGEPIRGLRIDIKGGTKFTWYAWRQGVRITGKFGFSTSVPDPIKEVVIIQTGRWLKRGQLGFQDKVQVIDKTAAFASVFQSDKDMINILTNYRRINL